MGGGEVCAWSAACACACRPLPLPMSPPTHTHPAGQPAAATAAGPATLTAERSGSHGAGAAVLERHLHQGVACKNRETDGKSVGQVAEAAARRAVAPTPAEPLRPRPPPPPPHNTHPHPHPHPTPTPTPTPPHPHPHTTPPPTHPAGQPAAAAAPAAAAPAGALTHVLRGDGLAVLVIPIQGYAEGACRSGGRGGGGGEGGGAVEGARGRCVRGAQHAHAHAGPCPCPCPHPPTHTPLASQVGGSGGLGDVEAGGRWMGGIAPLWAPAKPVPTGPPLTPLSSASQPARSSMPPRTASGGARPPSLTSLLAVMLGVVIQVQRLLLLRRRCGVGKVGAWVGGSGGLGDVEAGGRWMGGIAPLWAPAKPVPTGPPLTPLSSASQPARSSMPPRTASGGARPPSLTSLLAVMLGVVIQVQRLLLLRRRCGVGKVGAWVGGSGGLGDVEAGGRWMGGIAPLWAPAKPVPTGPPLTPLSSASQPARSSMPPRTASGGARPPSLTSLLAVMLGVVIQVQRLLLRRRRACGVGNVGWGGGGGGGGGVCVCVGGGRLLRQAASRQATPT